MAKRDCWGDQKGHVQYCSARRSRYDAGSGSEFVVDGGDCRDGMQREDRGGVGWAGLDEAQRRKP